MRLTPWLKSMSWCHKKSSTRFSSVNSASVSRSSSLHQETRCGSYSHSRESKVQISQHGLTVTPSDQSICADTLFIASTVNLYLYNCGQQTANSKKYDWNRSFNKCRSEASGAVKASSTLRVRSKLPCESTRSLLRAYSKLRCESI